MFSDLQKQFVKLQIQKSKVPTISAQLSELTEQGDELSFAINTLNDKMSSVDAETAGILLLADKGISDLKKGMETEWADIQSLQVKIAKLEAERESVVSELAKKTSHERELIAKLEAEAREWRKRPRHSRPRLVRCKRSWRSI
jgi:chromosome segregation ATPase